MGSREFEPVLKEVDTLFRVGTAAARADRELIGAFVARGEAAEVAFAALVERHGPMVLRVCRGELRDSHAAEDAFQATFLILARKAGSIRDRGSVASWLYGVARRVARRARVVEARRAERERRGARMAGERIGIGDGPPELVPEIQEEIDRLPEKYRAAIVLCDLEGLSREEAAGQLLVPSATVRVRLARARERLRGRLVRRGLGPGLVASALGADASAAMPTPLVDATIRAAMRIAAGRAAGASGPVAALVEGVIKAMMLTRLKTVVALLLTAAAMVLAAIPIVGAESLPAPPAQGPPAAVPKVAETRKSASPAVKRVAVETMKVVETPRTTNSIGSVQPFASADLYPKVSGFLKTQPVDIGDRVTRGQVVATLDAPELLAERERSRAMVDQAKARVAKARATVIVAEAALKAAAAEVEAARAEVASAGSAIDVRQKEHARIKELADRNAVEPRIAEEAESRLEAARGALAAKKSRSLMASAGREGAEAKLPEAKAGVEAAGADLRAAEAGLLKAELLVQQATIASPLDGIVTRRNFQAGDFVRSGDQAGARPLVSIVNAGKVRVVVDIPNADVPFLAPGAPATVQLGASGERSYKGTIARTAYALDPQTATLRAEIDFDNADGRLRPGQRATVIIDLEGHVRHLSIPRSALMIVGFDYAEILRVEGGRAVKTRIAFVNPSDLEQRVEVTKGLNEGDRVVVRPDHRMEGQAVEVEEVDRH